MTYLCNATLHTAHRRDVPIDDLDPEAISICRTIVEAIAMQPGGARVELPDMPGLSLIGRAGGKCMTAAVMTDEKLLISYGIATHRRCGAGLWRDLHDSSSLAITDPDRQPPTPWIGTLIGPGWNPIVAPDPALRTMLIALGSCLGAAWLDYIGERT